MTMAEIVPLHAYPPGLLEAHREFLEHYADCKECSPERDVKGRLRLCWRGYGLWHAFRHILPPGQDTVLGAVINPRSQTAHSPHEED